MNNNSFLNNSYFLYVEDDYSNRIVMSLMMDKVLGMSNFTIFDDSVDFLLRLKALPQKPDVIFLDVNVTPLDGFQMLNIIRSDPEYSNIKVIAVTASVMNEEVEQLRSSGFDGAIGKPFNVSSFPRLLRQILNGNEVWYVS